MSLIRKHVAVLQAWACLDLVCNWTAPNTRQSCTAFLLHLCEYSKPEDTDVITAYTDDDRFNTVNQM